MSRALTEAAKDLLKPKAGHADEPKKLPGTEAPLSLQSNETPTGGTKATVPTSKTTPPGKTPPGPEEMKSVPNTVERGSYSSDTHATNAGRKLKDSVNKQEKDDELYEETDMDEDFEIGDLVEDAEGNVGEITAITEEGIEVNWDVITEEKDEDESEEKGDDDDEDEDDDKETVKEELKLPTVDELDFDLSEDVTAMFSGEELSEEFKTKVTTIFEAAVKARVHEYAAQLDEAFDAKLNEGIETAVEVISESVEEYLDVAVNEWVENNEIAIQSNLRTELTEDFINGLRNLFVENYIDIPEDKIDVVDELSMKLEAVEAKLNEQIEKNIDMQKTLRESKKDQILRDLTEGLVETQKEKILSLAENVEFKDEETFERAISTLKENYFPTSDKPRVGKSQLDEDATVIDQEGKVQIIEENSNDPMDKYLKVLSRQIS